LQPNPSAATTFQAVSYNYRNRGYSRHKRGSKGGLTSPSRVPLVKEIHRCRECDMDAANGVAPLVAAALPWIGRRPCYGQCLPWRWLAWHGSSSQGCASHSGVPPMDDIGLEDRDRIMDLVEEKDTTEGTHGRVYDLLMFRKQLRKRMKLSNVTLHREYSSGIIFIFSQGRKYLYHV
jgi:hypothetical protein